MLIDEGFPVIAFSAATSNRRASSRSRIASRSFSSALKYRFTVAAEASIALATRCVDQPKASNSLTLLAFSGVTSNGGRPR